MSPLQIVVMININPIIARAFAEGTEVDRGMSQSLLVRILRDSLQTKYPHAHVSVGMHDTPRRKLKLIQPAQDLAVRRGVRDLFSAVLRRENWLVTL